MMFQKYEESYNSLFKEVACAVAMKLANHQIYIQVQGGNEECREKDFRNTRETGKTGNFSK